MQEKSFNVEFIGKTYNALYIKDAAKAEAAIAKYMSYPIDMTFGIDTETEALPQYSSIEKAGLSPHLAKIRLLQITNGKSVVVFDMKFIDKPEIFVEFLNTRKFVAHNALFDLQFFKLMGVKHMNLGCTFIMSKLLFHAAYPLDEGLRASLQAMCQEVFGTDILKSAQASDWSVPDLTYEQILYAALDPVICLELYNVLASHIVGMGMTNYYKLCKHAQHPIASMQLNGINLNVESHNEMVARWRIELFHAKQELQRITGLTNITGHTIGRWLETNLDPDTLALWPKTSMGKLQTDAHTFADFDYLEIVKPFSAFQKKEKLTSSFGRNLVNMINPATGKIHASYNLCGARTGRLSCSSPNLQQLPRDAEIRANFIAPPGYKLLCADYSQIELRVAAEVSRDPVMLDAYAKGIDLHRLTAANLSGKSLDAVTKEERQLAKAINFGLLFGLGAKKFAHYAKKSYGVEVSNDEALKSVRAFRELYSGYHAWQMQAAEMGASSGYAYTPFGKVRKLDPDNSYGASMNTPVQGGASECMLFALSILEKKFRDSGAKSYLANCVHDEIVVAAPESEVEESSAALEASMISGFTAVFPKGITRGLVEVHNGANWGEAKG